jgi:hypothetical protein
MFLLSATFAGMATSLKILQTGSCASIPMDAWRRRVENAFVVLRHAASFKTYDGGPRF